MPEEAEAEVLYEVRPEGQPAEPEQLAVEPAEDEQLVEPVEDEQLVVEPVEDEQLVVEPEAMEPDATGTVGAVVAQEPALDVPDAEEAMEEASAGEVLETGAFPRLLVLPVNNPLKSHSIEIRSDTELYDRPFPSGKPVGTYDELGGTFVRRYLGWYAVQLSDDRFLFVRKEDAAWVEVEAVPSAEAPPAPEPEPEIEPVVEPEPEVGPVVEPEPEAESEEPVQ
jgi:hypothetical protein